MQIMFEKGLVTRDDSAKAHIYKPNVSKEKTQSQFVGKMISIHYLVDPQLNW